MLSRKHVDILINVMCTRFDAESFIFCNKRVAFSLPKALHSECIWCKSRKVLARIVFRFSGIVIRRECRVLRRCWVNFQCRGVLLTWIIVEQGPTALAVGAGEDCSDMLYSRLFSFPSPSLETARCKLKYCIKGPLNPK